MQEHTKSSTLENAIALQKYGVGQPVRRKEDDTLVRGKGRYTDDFNLPGQAHAVVVRSTHAHGLIRGIGTDAARAMPGVLGVWTGKDLDAAGYGPFTCGLPLKSRDGSPCSRPTGNRWRPTRSVSSAIPSPSWSPTRWRRRATPPKPSSSISSRCRR